MQGGEGTLDFHLFVEKCKQVLGSCNDSLGSHTETTHHSWPEPQSPAPSCPPFLSAEEAGTWWPDPAFNLCHPLCQCEPHPMKGGADDPGQGTQYGQAAAV